MKVMTTGHRYELENFENKELVGQTIQFIQKIPVTEGSTELKTVLDGTTNEEVLLMLVDRLNHLQSKFPCRENAIVITHLETAGLWLGKRTADRITRGVEGKQLK